MQAYGQAMSFSLVSVISADKADYGKQCEEMLGMEIFVAFIAADM